MKPEPYMTAEEAAAYLKVEIHTVYRLAKKGQIPGARVGGQWRFRRRTLLTWFRAKRAPPIGA